MQTNKLCHHGTQGMRWGVRNGPPYPLNRSEHNRTVTSRRKGERGVRISHDRNREAVNDIFASMPDKEKWFLAGNVTDDIVPKEYVSKEEYGPRSTLANTNILWKWGTPVAFCDVWINRPREGEVAIGTRSGEEYRKKGYATTVAKEAIKWFNDSDNLDVLYYYPHTENKASIAFAQKLGFKMFFQDDQVTGLEIRKSRNSK